MNELSMMLIILGVILIAVGVAINYGKFLHLGKLPGDIRIEKENYKFYFPITTSILLSLILTLIFWIIIWIRK